LAQLPPSECANYELVELDSVASYWTSLVLRKERHDVLESLNVIVAERMDFVKQLLDDSQLSDECREYIYPPHIAQPTFVPLTMYTLSGAFVLVICASLFALLVFIFEVFVAKIFRKTHYARQQRLADFLDATMAQKIEDGVKEEMLDEVQFYYNVLRDLLILHEK
jgi:hypothetical protein